MSFSSGVYTAPVNSFNDAVTQTLIDPDDFNEILTDLERGMSQVVPVNYSLAAAVGSNALTISLKTVAGADPSASSPIMIPFRDVTIATGTPSYLSVIAATSLTISSGSTLGTTNSVPFRFWIVAFNDGGTFRLGAVNLRSGEIVMPLRSSSAYSSTAEGGAGAADSAQVIYTGTAVTSKMLRILGYVEYSSGLGTVGTYASVPTKIQVMGPNITLPGQPVQRAGSRDGAVATGTTTMPVDDTIPQSTEGNQVMSQAITPTFEGNLLMVEHEGNYAYSVATNVGVALFQDSGADALSAIGWTTTTTNVLTAVRLRNTFLAGTSSATTFKIRAGGNGAGTVTFNGASAARLFGGVMYSTLSITEIMA